ncbi:hypothetical protein DACRYDRAFT_104351 [Dacryopinax primogenitus]|uniref:DUF6699 domain-containing protein n=1 Tax=Dacryopinax primogenitus (strain DJM 731) TaxID=1858805 RepID=M5GGP8_DACPD|nr:uncharacterized protein DACRYDRAFT_104351 [Dacryopinax primogenitus]EJU05863.1 hypothetical protein DACRYDRAFT_104351 [Dacryopinax primogenitus]
MFSGGRHGEWHGGGIPIPSLDATSPYNPPNDLRRSPGQEQQPPLSARSPREQPVQLGGYDYGTPAGYPSPPYPAPYPPYPYPYQPQTPYGYPPYLSPNGYWPPPPPPGAMPQTPYTPGHPAPTLYPPQPGYVGGSRRAPRDKNMSEDYQLDRSEKFSRPAEFRAPSLSLAEIGFLRPKGVDINPLLSITSDSKPVPALNWNLAFPPSTAKKSGENTDRALGMDERQCPATWPAIKQMTIVLDDPTLSRWEILVVGNRGGCVTVGDVLTGVHSGLQAMIHPSEWEAITGSTSTHVRQYWKRIVSWANFNRSTDPRAPGGHMANSMQRIDFLCANTIWGGIKVEETQSRGLAKHVQSGYWIFKLELMTNDIGEGTMPPPGRGTA